MMKYIKKLFRKEVKESLEDKTYKIFKATRLHPAIPENEQEAFSAHCSQLAKDPVLDRIIDEVVGEYAESIIQKVKTEKGLRMRRNRMLGADKVRKRLIEYAQKLEQKEDFNPHESI